MSDKSFYINTLVYSGIVNLIKNKAISCNLSAKPSVSVKAWDKTDIGPKMKTVLESVYATEVLYKKQSSEALPAALTKVCNSIKSTDKSLADSIKIDNDKNGE